MNTANQPVTMFGIFFASMNHVDRKQPTGSIDDPYSPPGFVDPRRAQSSACAIRALAKIRTNHASAATVGKHLRFIFMKGMKTTSLAAIVAATLAAQPQEAKALLIQPTVGQDGAGYLLTNNDSFAWDTLTFDFQDGYSPSMNIITPSNLTLDGQTGNELTYNANPDVPNVGPFTSIQTGVDYVGLFENIDFRNFTSDPNVFGTLEITAFNATGSKSSSASTFYMIPDLTLYGNPTGQEPCAGLPPGACEGPSKIPEPAPLGLLLGGLAAMYAGRKKLE